MRLPRSTTLKRPVFSRLVMMRFGMARAQVLEAGIARLVVEADDGDRVARPRRRRPGAGMPATRQDLPREDADNREGDHNCSHHDRLQPGRPRGLFPR